MAKSRDEIEKAVLLLRFHTFKQLKPHPAYSTYSAIAKALNITYN